jgi:solute carrier family 9B (sodium/hydrogen exchanger), member 1/2
MIPACMYASLCFFFLNFHIFCNYSTKSIQNNWPTISQPLTILLVLLVLWGVTYPILPELTQPNSPLMRMMFLFVGAQICGILVSLTGLPDMLGMLFWGVLYTNIGLGQFTGYGKLESLLR